MKEQKDIVKRGFLVAIFFALLALAVITKLLIIQFHEGPELRAQAEKEVIKEMAIPAERGNIYSADGKLLATSMPVYDIHFDPLSVDQDVFAEEVADLAQQLAKMPGLKSASQWESFLRNGQRDGHRYLKIAEDLSFSQLQSLRSYPIFNRGRFRGGLIEEQQNFRKMPLGKIAERTIGRERRYSATGMEGAFSNYLSGKDGRRLKQKVSQNSWKPLSDQAEVEPENGYDLVSTIDTRMQEVVHHALLSALERFEADHGCAVLMEVETGAIKGIANLGRTEEGTYFEKRNYAIWESTEPGSTFKLASVLALLEDGLADTSDLVDTENGVFTIYGKKIRDSNNKGYGTISLKKAFEKSSNVGIAKLVYEHYADDPQRFVDRLYTIGLDRRLELPIRGEGRPVIPTPGQASWSGISLPWMSFGYQVSFTPMQVLSFYNAIANDGVMVKPRLVEEIRQHGRSVEKREPVIINPAICSKETILKLQNLLLGAVEKGTATNIRNPLVQIAGKTGTCQLNYWIKETSDYQASFAGYFPAEDPKYSCIVVINKPNFHRGYYGSTVAAPVFAAIAKSIYRKIPQPVNLEPVNLTALTAEKSWQKQIHNQQLLPNLKGLSGAEVISELENAGHKVRVKGNGLVKWQYPSAGTPLTNNRIIELQLG